MTTTRQRLFPLVSAVGAFLSVLTISSGSDPGRFLLTLNGTAFSSVIVFVTLAVGGWWVLRNATASAWRWGGAIGVLFATAELAGNALHSYDAVAGPLFESGHRAWTVVHWLGLSWLASCGLAALIWALDSYGGRTDRGQDPSSRGLIGALRSPGRARRRGAYAVVFGIIALSRLPYVLTYWPGIVYFDTFRAYSYIRGIVPLDTYEPVGSTLYIGAMQGLGALLGLGDAGRVALSTMILLGASATAFTFLFARLANWGLPRRFWIAGLAWIVLVPALGYYSVTLVKDVPFSIAMTVFTVCIGEVTLGDASAARKRWPWVMMTASGVMAITMRNNGVYIVLLTLPALLLILRRSRKQLLIVLAALVAAVALWLGPIFAVLHVQSGPAAETYSVPLQQLGRIAKYHANALSPADQEFMTRLFAGMPPSELGRHYVPALADPMKLRARMAWDTHTTVAFLRGWARIASQYPMTAIGATMANTVGYWDPEAPPYDGIDRWSANDARTIHLDIPSGRPTTGVAGALESSGLLPSRGYDGVHNDGYRLIPVLAQAMTPGTICWLWFVAGLLVLRKRRFSAMALFVPAGLLLLTFFAGPVSGGERYTMSMVMTLPLALAAVILTALERPSRDPRDDPATSIDRNRRTPGGLTPPEPGDRVPVDKGPLSRDQPADYVARHLQTE